MSMAFPLLLGVGAGIVIDRKFKTQIDTATQTVIGKAKGTTDETPKAELQGPSKDVYSGSSKSSDNAENTDTSSKTSSDANTEPKSGGTTSNTENSTKPADDSSEPASSMPSVSDTVDQIVGNDTKSSEPPIPQ